ncbi:putative histidine kinase HHK11p [Aaosphaeria arxii CBS 175.79]|uniref:Putative histidine kinase HHK11p n=1 Tax=Aaosphaeria arxii CBS 175.79 TaxID=1450172 RepID=A0A6A5XDT6_9PLEO|nr:putative histidine kinase HHK11p [Aaosphaeria arxii CBS 175.79]KAF2011040.1 putative histidine kinase HHK11p [Aaosphaeria arxii CBS 175.79]
MLAESEQSQRENRYHNAIGQTQRELARRSLTELRRETSQRELTSYALIDILDIDDRPSFIIDLSLPSPRHALINPIYHNPALAAAGRLWAQIQEPSNPLGPLAEGNAAFRCWVFDELKEIDLVSRGRTHSWEGYIWSATTIKQHRIVSGVLGPPTRVERSSSLRTIDSREHKEPKNLPQLLESHLPSVPNATPSGSSRENDSYPLQSDVPQDNFDFTRDPPSMRLTPHLEYFRSIGWANTKLGPMKDWSPQLRSAANLVLNDTHPALLLWSDDVIMIYNEAYVEVIGLLHPCMGQSSRVAGKDYWGYFKPLLDHIRATGETLTENDMPIFIDRHGFLEEVFYSFQFMPILDGDGKVGGYYQILRETTQNNILQRRVSSLVEIGSQTAKARDPDAYWDLVLNTLAINEKDAPFALLYAVEHEVGTDVSSISSPGSTTSIDRCILKGAIGVEADHPIAPSVIALDESGAIFSPHLRKAAKSRRPTLVHFEDIDVPKSVLDGIAWKGYGEPCRCVVVCPLLPTTSEQLLGFMILGVNPRRPFDLEYEQFVHVTNRLLGTSLASVVLFDEELRQKETAIGQAALIQEHLLAELSNKEKKFQRFAERSDIAIFILSPEGRYTYRNQRWFEIFKDAANADDVAMVWKSVVFPEDISFCEGLFSKLVDHKTPISFELKTTMRFDPPDDLAEPSDSSQEHYQWIICSAYAELNSKGDIVEIVGNVTDISKQKWAEELQKMRTDSALESKDHLEHFIDTTSHEMRNPLSAIMQCADEILTSTRGSRDGGLAALSAASYEEIFEQALDAAQTIAQCAQHMKRIVDDILTISKLDSGLLVITPVDAQPHVIVSHAVKMFNTEAKASGIEMKFIIEESYRDLGLDWVSLDPTRLLQVLINLITNAVKFTRLEPVRLITVSMGASSTPPPSTTPGGVQYITTKLVGENRQLRDDWKHGSAVYLEFSVRDTGRGLAEDEKETLFSRFSQASPRTHIHYGGSGLGLFISRRLTEMQGGSIGLASEYKKGSTFAFYIKARRSRSGSRRGSLPHVFPEDIRHRPHTPKEFDRLLNPVHPYPVPKLSGASPHPHHHEQPSSSQAPHQQQPTDNTSSPPVFDEDDLRCVPETLHVLVVEDNLVNQKVLAKQLRKLGCEVSVANHGVEALDFLKKTRHWDHSKPCTVVTTSNNGKSRSNSNSKSNKPTTPPHPGGGNAKPLSLSLILMDWEMPIMNGLTCVSKIRALEREGVVTTHIPIIGVTANVRQQQITTAMEVGMDDVVGKPFRVADLLARMRGVISGTVGIKAESIEGSDGEKVREGS